MDTHALINWLVFFSLFLGISSLLQIFSKRTSFPYTVSLLVVGFLSQIVLHLMHIETHISLDPSIIYYFILPLMLFEAALHINIHQFRLQFWTISFISTFGLLLSMGVVAAGLAILLGFPWSVGLLFGALISATDPIAVLAIFKTLGAPKRLSLIADGESMFNDATAVIAFKLVAGFAFATSYFNSDKVFSSFGTFSYMFFGSIILGALLGVVGSELVRRIKNDPIVEATVTFCLALGAFALADHFVGMSGVITTVMAGLTFGNLGKTRISPTAKHFVNDLWEYIAFLSVSLVFFFAAFQLDPGLLIAYGTQIPWVIGIVLIARAVSVYVSFAISNRSRLFKNEPDVPLSWQHILNWGGLRGVIPLVLVYSIPDEYIYKPALISFTLACFVFTLLINALTIRWLLERLRLHLPKNEEEIIEEEHQIYLIEQKRLKLLDLPKREFYKQIIHSVNKKLDELELLHQKRLNNLTNQVDMELSFKLQAIEISRNQIEELFHLGYISEGVALEYETQLDLQQDALEYPEVHYGRGYSKGGRLPNRKLFRERLRKWQTLAREFPIVKQIFGQHEEEIITERLMMIKMKLSCVDHIERYLNIAKPKFADFPTALAAIKMVLAEYKERNLSYQAEFQELKKQYPEIVNKYQSKLLENIVAL